MKLAKLYISPYTIIILVDCMEEDEYELVPMSPIRRLERRMERVEKTGSGVDTTRELIEIVRANQSVIDEIVKINSDMMKKITDLINNVNELTAKINDFMGRIEFSNEEPKEDAHTNERLEKLEKRLNALLLSSVARSRFKRPATAAPVIQ